MRSPVLLGRTAQAALFSPHFFLLLILFLVSSSGGLILLRPNGGPEHGAATSTGLPLVPLPCPVLPRALVLGPVRVADPVGAHAERPCPCGSSHAGSISYCAFNFHGIISSCFEPYMPVYIELEEKSSVEQLDKLIQDEKWETEEGSQTNILSSSMQVFLVIRRSLKRCSALTKNQTLFNLFQVFQRILKAYAAKLYARLPKGGTGIVAAATGTDGQISVWVARKPPGFAFIHFDDRKDAQDAIRELDGNVAM